MHVIDMKAAIMINVQGVEQQQKLKCTNFSLHTAVNFQSSTSDWSMSIVCVYNVKQGQASMFLQIHFPSAAQDLVMQREHDLSLKHGETHVGLEFATLERIMNSANPPRPGDLPRPRPLPRGVCLRWRLGSSSVSSCTAWQHFRRRVTLNNRTSTI